MLCEDRFSWFRDRTSRNHNALLIKPQKLRMIEINTMLLDVNFAFCRIILKLHKRIITIP